MTSHNLGQFCTLHPQSFKCQDFCVVVKKIIDSLPPDRDVIYGRPLTLIDYKLHFKLEISSQVFDDGEKFINVQSLLSHPSYNNKTNDFDFAIIRLSTPAPISSTLGIACLPPDVTQDFAGTNMTISGWGTTSAGGNFINVL